MSERVCRCLSPLWTDLLPDGTALCGLCSKPKAEPEMDARQDGRDRRAGTFNTTATPEFLGNRVVRGSD